MSYGRTCRDNCGRIRRRARRLAGSRRRLVGGQAGVPCPLGQGDDVDLPPQRYLHLHLFPHFVHECTNIRHRALAESERGLLPRHRRRAHPADPDRDHDHGSDHQQRDHGDGRELRLPPPSRQYHGADADHWAFGATFVGMQAFEWTKLIREGVRPWGNPLGATQFGSCFFMITGFHGLHVSAGVIYLTVVALRVWRGFYDRKGSYETVEITGLYWHFVDLVWVFIFAFFYLW